MAKICKFYLKNSCKQGDKCSYIHSKDICKNYFFDGNCKREKCNFKHIDTVFKKKPKNTENFEPSHKPSDMNILIGDSNNIYKNKYAENDLIIVPNFLKENFNNEYYNKLLKEIEESEIDKNKLWKLWHGDNHLIADDNLNWKEKIPTFTYILSEIEKYFDIEIKNTRLNLYKDSNDWKPFHHDAAAVKKHIAEIQDFTVGISLGATRDIAFESIKDKTVVSVPLLNCTVYGFAKDININWKHGIPQIHHDKSFSDGRISIIVWGKIK